MCFGDVGLKQVVGIFASRGDVTRLEALSSSSILFSSIQSVAGSCVVPLVMQLVSCSPRRVEVGMVDKL